VRNCCLEPFYLVVPRNHRLASKSRVHLKQIENDSFLLLKDGPCFRENMLSAGGRAGLKPNRCFESGQFSTILAMVAANTGVSLVPQMAVEERPGCCFIPCRWQGNLPPSRCWCGSDSTSIAGRRGPFCCTCGKVLRQTSQGTAAAKDRHPSEGERTAGRKAFTRGFAGYIESCETPSASTGA
jgi:hypothetical protein